MDPDYLMYQHKKTEIDEDIVAGFTEETEFRALAIELFKEIMSIHVPLMSIYRTNKRGKTIPYNKEEAALIGNLVRLFKLNRAILDEFANGREEILHILLRCFAETYINIRYFLKFKDEHTINHYIKYSLRQEKNLIDIIKRNVEENGGPNNLEDRMKKSIKRTFEISGMTEEDISNSSKWENKIKSRISDLITPDFYVLIYGNTSHAIHGNWQDLINFHLKAFENGFLPNIEFNVPNCKTLNVINLLTCELIKEYSVNVLPSTKKRDKLIHEIEDIIIRIFKFRNLHEEYYHSKFNKTSSAQ